MYYVLHAFTAHIGHCCVDFLCTQIGRDTNRSGKLSPALLNCHTVRIELSTQFALSPDSNITSLLFVSRTPVTFHHLVYQKLFNNWLSSGASFFFFWWKKTGEVLSCRSDGDASLYFLLFLCLSVIGEGLFNFIGIHQLKHPCPFLHFFTAVRTVMKPSEWIIYQPSRGYLIRLSTSCCCSLSTASWRWSKVLGLNK